MAGILCALRNREEGGFLGGGREVSNETADSLVVKLRVTCDYSTIFSTLVSPVATGKLELEYVQDSTFKNLFLKE